MLGETVTTRTVGGSEGVASALGAAFIVVEADQGPEGPTKIASISRWQETFGARSTASATAYDWADSLFALSGRTLYVVRPLNAGAKAAKLVLKDSAAKPTLTVEYATKGVGGNSYKIEVTVASEKAVVKLLDSEGNPIEANPEGDQAEIIAWWAKHTAYVTVKQSEELEHTSALPAALAATTLSGGTNPTALTDAEKVAGLAKFTSNYGPGLVVIPGGSSEEVQKGLAEHVTKLRINRRAAVLLEGSTVTALKTAKASLSEALRSYVIYLSSSAVVQGVTPGTTRTVDSTALLAALFAQSAATDNMNTATAGSAWPVSPWVLSFTNTFSHEEAEALVEDGINVWGEEQGQLCLVSGSFVTGISPESGAEGEVFWSFAATGERMALVYDCEPIMAEVDNKAIDGQGNLLSRLQGRLQGVIAEHWRKGALFGASASEAGKAIVGEPVNTLAAEQKGAVAAQLEARISESVQSAALVVISRPITATL